MNPSEVFVDMIQKRIKNNRNFLGVFVGGTGSGKSYAALRIAETLDPSFDISRCVFRAKDFMKLIKKLENGQAIVFDEAGTKEGMATREWYTTQNKFMSYVMQVFRHKNLIVLFTVPDISYIDKQVRKLFHMMFVTAGIRRKKKICRLKPFIVSPGRTHEKVYHVYPTVKGIDGPVKLKRLNVKMPSIKLRHRYEKVKAKFANELYDDAMGTLDEKVVKAPLTEKEQIVYNLRKYTDMSQHQIAEKMGVTQGAISNKIRRIRKKEYTIR